MGKTALDILEDEAEWAVDKVLYRTLDYFSENMDSFPATGFGLQFVQNSAEKHLVKRVEKDLVPVIEAHMGVQIEVVGALSEGRDAEDVKEEYRDQLLETNPLWDAVEGAEARDDLLSADMDACGKAAEWVGAAGGREFESFAELAQNLGKSSEEAVAEIEPLLKYLPDILECYRDELDLSGYSALLTEGKVRDWFVDTLIEWLEKSQEEALEEMEVRVRNHQSVP